MQKKIALIASAIVTAFILIFLGGMIFTVRGSSQAAPAAAQDTSTTVDTTAAITPTLDASIQQIINDREAQYRQMIDQANARLQQAQQDQAALQAQLDSLQNNNQPAAAPAGIAPEQAASVAANYLGQSSIYSVESTMVNGIDVYKVTFSSGDIAYVDLNGQVIGVSVAQPAQNASVPVGNASAHEHDHEHEGGHDD